MIFVVPLITVLAAIVVALSIVGNLDTVPHRLATGEYCRRFKNLCALGNPAELTRKVDHHRPVVSADKPLFVRFRTSAPANAPAQEPNGVQEKGRGQGEQQGGEHNKWSSLHMESDRRLMYNTVHSSGFC